MPVFISGMGLQTGITITMNPIPITMAPIPTIITMTLSTTIPQ